MEYALSLSSAHCCCSIFDSQMAVCKIIINCHDWIAIWRARRALRHTQPFLNSAGMPFFSFSVANENEMKVNWVALCNFFTKSGPTPFRSLCPNVPIDSFLPMIIIEMRTAHTLCDPINELESTVTHKRIDTIYFMWEILCFINSTEPHFFQFAHKRAIAFTRVGVRWNQTTHFSSNNLCWAITSIAQ